MRGHLDATLLQPHLVNASFHPEAGAQPLKPRGSDPSTCSKKKRKLGRSVERLDLKECWKGSEKKVCRKVVGFYHRGSLFKPVLHQAGRDTTFWGTSSTHFCRSCSSITLPCTPTRPHNPLTTARIQGFPCPAFALVLGRPCHCLVRRRYGSCCWRRSDYRESLLDVIILFIHAKERSSSESRFPSRDDHVEIVLVSSQSH